MDHRIEWRWLGLRPLITDLNTDAWIEALFMTQVDTLRELHVASRGLSWVTMPTAERRRVYADVLRRVRHNFQLWSCGSERNGQGMPWEKILDILMERDQELSALGDPLG